MADMYSPTKINTFDTCRLKYKYAYIDRLESEIQGIEAFRGEMVHKVLEEFYKLVKAGSVQPLEWLTAKYEELWNKNYLESIKIVKQKLSPQDYFDKGRQCLIDYYQRYEPFNHAKVVDTERKVLFGISYSGKEYRLQGIIDRIDWDDKADAFQVHDYKVTSRLMTQQEADTDWQLGLYHVALKQLWPDAKNIKLIWHSLLFNAEITSARTEIQADELKKQVSEKIESIESCQEFAPTKSHLCDWCTYQDICPLWRHPKAVENISVNEYKNEPGVKLVAKYVELEADKEELLADIEVIEEEQRKIEEAAVEFADAQKISIIDGPGAQLKVDIKKELRSPIKKDDSQAWQGLRQLLIDEGKYQEVSTVNNNMLNYRIRNSLWPKELMEKVRAFLKYEVTKTVKLIKK